MLAWEYDGQILQIVPISYDLFTYGEQKRVCMIDDNRIGYIENKFKKKKGTFCLSKEHNDKSYIMKKGRNYAMELSDIMR